MSNRYTQERADEIVGRAKGLEAMYRAKSVTRRVFTAGIAQILREENVPEGRSTSEILMDQMALQDSGVADPAREQALAQEYDAAAWGTMVRFRMELLLNPPRPGSGIR